METIIGISAGFIAIGFYILWGRYYLRRHTFASAEKLTRDRIAFSRLGKSGGLMTVLLIIYLVFFYRTIAEIRGLEALVIFGIFICVGFSAAAFSIRDSAQATFGGKKNISGLGARQDSAGVTHRSFRSRHKHLTVSVFACSASTH